MTTFFGTHSFGLCFHTRLLLTLICLVALTQGQEPATKPDFSKVESLIQRRVAAGMPSVAIAVTHHGQIIWEYAAGMGDVEGKRIATVRTPYYLASVSKTITATALMELVAQGRIELDRPVNAYLPSAKLRSPMWDVSKATVRRVLNHTAGLSTYDRDCVVDDRTCERSTSAAVRRYGVIVWPPGERFDYSNLGYGILGEVVAHTSG